MKDVGTDANRLLEIVMARREIYNLTLCAFLYEERSVSMQRC